MRVRSPLAFALAVASLVAAEARPMATEAVPEPLKPWVPWVLHGLDDLGCPALFSDPRARRCAWPSAVELTLEDRGGTFEQSWAVYREVDVALPGDPRHWPQEVKVDGDAAAVGERDGRPVLRLGPGTHRISGRFQWDRLPDSLTLPPDSGRVGLRVKGETMALPDLRPDGQVWLKTEGAGEAADRLDIQVFRRLTDEIPVEITTRVELDVSGQERELAFRGALLPDTIPLRLESPLPARIEPGGELRLKVRPGHWVVEVLGRYPADTATFTLAEPRDPWPKQEVWVFDARNHLRLVEVEGVPAVDPSQTTLPDTWKGLPAYRVNPGDTLTLKLVRRGDPEPEPDRLILKRDLWLDFDGGGYTVADAITGTMTRGWRLTAGEQLALGRVAQDGVPQLITALPGSPAPRGRGAARHPESGRPFAPGRRAAIAPGRGLGSGLSGAFRHLAPAARLAPVRGQRDGRREHDLAHALDAPRFVPGPARRHGHRPSVGSGLGPPRARGADPHLAGARGADHHLAAPVRRHGPRAGPARGTLVVLGTRLPLRGLRRAGGDRPAVHGRSGAPGALSATRATGAGAARGRARRALEPSGGVERRDGEDGHGPGAGRSGVQKKPSTGRGSGGPP